MEQCMEGVDMGFDGFVKMVFNNPVQEPFSFIFSFPEDLTPLQRSEALGFFIVTGAKMKYNKQLAELTEKEITNLRDYLLSIGFDIDYKLNVKTKQVTDYREDNTPYQRDITFNHYDISFKVADMKLGRIHSHNLPI